MTTTQNTAAPAITWKLTGKPNGPGGCEHCGRSLVYRYQVTSSTGQQMIVGRGCLKGITGWTLTAAQAERQLALLARQARWAIVWDAYAATRADEAATIAADIAAYEEMYRGRGIPAGVSHEIRSFIRENHPQRDEVVASYMGQRRDYPWVR